MTKYFKIYHKGESKTMYATGTKKMLNMLILEVITKYADEEHPIMQKTVVEIIERDYGMTVNRKTVKNNIDSLKEMGYEISEIEGKGYYIIDRAFEESELRVLIDSVLFSKTIDGNQAMGLIQKLENFGSNYFKSKVSHVSTSPSLIRTNNQEVFLTVNAINDAIDEKKKIKFRYNTYESDFELHDRGFDYIVNPYQMIAANGFYYLLGNMNKYDDISYYRIDKMKNVVILEEAVKPMKEVKGLEKGLDLPKHMAEHIYMFCGESVPIKMKCSMSIVDALVDWFGKDITVLKTDKEKKEITVRVICNLNAMSCWALQYGPYVEVLEPKELREEIKEAVTIMKDRYL